jgi:predicted Zn-ribbon and HTH transcriptional regulator
MPDLTLRQQIMQSLGGRRYTARDLAHLHAIPERQIEEHLEHIALTVARDNTRRFMLEAAACEDCGYRFRARSRVTRPGRCPKCRSERISSPRFGIELRQSS